MSVWEKFENIISIEEFQEVASKKYEKPTAGHHNVELLAIETTETADGYPLVKFKFKDIDDMQFISCSMFLVNKFNPDKTADNIDDVIKRVRKLGNDIDFAGMVKLDEDISKTEVGGHYVINIRYRNENSKYPEFDVINRIPDDINETFETTETVEDEDLPF